ncbi:unnamed protein product [Blepharisma stoltei]|uniref:Uncharacterized protein n=1 Tax=Blepharisma stoltei TaxID=1481888 RepID=A0AAU9JI81_9CILI|nr:unnamed protein product [Blepharisma stoltei]
MKIFIALIAQIWLAACLSIGVKDSTLDPGRILWPKETWVSSPIQVSQTNAGSSVILTFTFRPSTTLSNGILEVDLPSGLSGGPFYLSGNFVQNQDQSLSTTSITLPSSPGVYGPFVLITRSSSTGQIYDANYIFGCLATTSSVPTSSTLIVTNAAASPIVGTTDTLYFAFSIIQSLWKYDIIEIVPPSTFTPSLSVSCASVTVTGTINLLYGPAKNNNLPCALAAQSSSTTGPQTVSSSSNSVYIYGLSQDVYLSSSILSIKLSVSTFTYPGYQQPSSSNTWKLKIWRWGTSTLIASYIAPGGPATPTYGSITATWTPVSGISATDVVSGMTIFTKVAFTTSHDIPAGGTAVIVFSNVDISGKWWAELDNSGSSGSSQCYITPAISGASCTVNSSTQVTLTFTSGKKSGAITIALLVTFSSGPKIASIITSNGSYNIDYSASLPSWTLSSANLAYNYFKFHAMGDASDTTNTKYPALANSGTYSTGFLYGADTSHDLFWAFKPAATWTTSTALTITLQMSTSALSLTQPYIGSGFTAYELNSALSGSATALSGSSLKGTYTVSGSTITVGFTTAPTSSYYFIFAFGGSMTALPYVSSNLGTFYECYATSTTGSSKEIGSSVYSVLTKDYGGSGIYAKPLCKDNNAPGIPLLSVFTAKIMTIDFGSASYVLEIQIANGGDLGTGLNAGDSIPLQSSAGSSVSATLYSISNPTTIRITGLGSIATSTTVSTFLAMGVISGATTFDSTSYLYYTTSSDPSIKNALYMSQITQITSMTSGTTSLTSGSQTSSWGVSISSSLTITAKAASSTTSNTYIGIGLPVGFTLSSPAISVASAMPTSSYYASNSNAYSKGGFIVGISTSSTFAFTSGTNVAMSVTGVVAPGYAGSSSSSNTVYFNLFAVTSGGVGGSCSISDATHLSGIVNLGSIGTVTCTPSATYAAGPDSVSITISLSLVTANPIPAGGKITLILSSSWSYYSSTCTASGLSDMDSTNKVTCSIASSMLTITKFAAIPSGTINISIPQVLPPLSAGNYQCFTTVLTQDAKSNYIDTGTGLTQNVVLTSPGTAGTSTSITATAYPNFAGASGVDIYLSFSLSKALPAGSLIGINPGFATWSRSTGDIKDYCWASIDYKSCTIISTTKLEITTTKDLIAGTTIQIYLDSVLSLPSTVGATSSGWQISTSWQSTTITSDPNPGTSFTINAGVSTLIAISSVKISDVKNAAEAATYVFSFSSGADVASGDYFVIQFPRNFDPYIGDAINTYSDCLPNTWLLSCNSTALGSVSCASDHWYLLINGISKTSTASTILDLTVQSVRNPAAGTTGYFNIYHYASAGTVKAYFTSTTSVTTTSVSPSSIILKDVLSSSSQLVASSKYTFDFYVASATYTNDIKFVITFPEQFNLQLYIGTSTACSTSYYDESNSAGTDYTKALSWISATSCAVSGQQVTLAIPSGTSQAFASTSRVQISLTSINNPQWGIDRSDVGWDNIYTATYGNFDYWTSRFVVSAISATSTAISAKSYGILNSAYLGYSLNTISAIIGSYDPATKNGKIQVAPGTQTSDITITLDDNWPLKSRSLKLTPTTNTNYPDSGKLKYTSAHYNWIIYQMCSSLNFRVSALTGAAVGIYYIDWAVNETPQTGLSNQYSAPLSIIVEVCTLSAATIIIADIPNLIIGAQSIPIAVTLTNSPASDLTITPSFGSSTSLIAITPSSLAFKPDINVLYFQLTVSSSYTATSPTLSFTLTGTDVAAFVQPTSKSLSVSTTSSTTVSATVTLSSAVKSGTEAVITATCSQNIVLYWSLSCKGSVIPSFSEIVAATADLVTRASDTYYLQEQLDIDYEATETAPDYNKGDTDIQSFFRRKHKEHCATPWTSSQVIYAGEAATIDLNWLMGATDYTFTAYAANEVVNSTTPTTNNFTTAPLPTLSTYTVTFAGSVAQSSGFSIKSTIAKNMGINPAWLTGQVYISSSSRMLIDSIGRSAFTYNVLYDRSKPYYSPSKIIANIDEIQLTSDLYKLVGVSPTLSSGSVTTQTTPSWVAAPVNGTVGETSAVFTATSTQDGIVCVSCTESVISDKNVYAWQVVDGLDGNSLEAYADCENSTATVNTTLTVSGLTQGTVYYCYFTACNSYPLWPSCIDYTSTTPLASVTINTTTPVSDDSGAIILAVTGFLLFFN